MTLLNICSRSIDKREMESDDDRKRRALIEAFGESSSDESFGREEEEEDGGPTWEPVEAINGLWLCPNFLSGEQQASLISAIEREGWLGESSHNQAMRFGDLPEWATELAGLIRESVCSVDVSYICDRRLISDNQYTEEPYPLPFDLLWREPLFDQLIVNTYKPYEGICAHVDLMRFQDGIAIISLESACVMHFTRSERETSIAETLDEEVSPMRIPVLLKPGSLILMSGEARYLWKHEINRKLGFQLWEGKEIKQKRRTSITLRKLCPAPK